MKEKKLVKFKGIELEEGTFTRKDYDDCFILYDLHCHLIYMDYLDGRYTKYEYDENGNLVYKEDSDGNWTKYEYDENRNLTYWENSNGYWTKYEYDKNGIQISHTSGYKKDKENES